MYSTAEKIKQNPKMATIMGWMVFILFACMIVLICTFFANRINHSTLENSISKMVRADVGEFTYQDLGKVGMEPMGLISEEEQKKLTTLQKKLFSSASIGTPHIYLVQTKYVTYKVMIDPNKHLAMNAVKQPK